MKIVVPIDNTLASQPLLDVLAGMHWYEGTEIVLLTVVPKWELTSDAPACFPTWVRDTESLAVELRSALPACEVSFFIREGDPKVEIVSFAREAGAHMIIAPPPKDAGSQPFGESIAQAIISHAHCPVFVAKENYGLVMSPQASFKTVLVPVDDSIYADIAIRWLLNFRWSPQTRFVLTSVIEHESARPVAYNSLVARAQFLSTVLRTNNISMDIRAGDPTDGIISLARKHAAELIVIGSHGRTGIHKVMFGSVSEELARKGPFPILIVRGIAESDDNWHRTGVFRKPKLEEITQHTESSPRNYSSGGQPSPHIMPGGMH